jgi:hypothetical protein
MAQNLGTEEPRIIRMAQQVKDVLPHVPLNVIARDLGMYRPMQPATRAATNDYFNNRLIGRLFV